MRLENRSAVLHPGKKRVLTQEKLDFFNPTLSEQSHRRGL